MRLLAKIHPVAKKEIETGNGETLERQGSGLIFNQRLGAYFYANQGVAEAFSACLLPCTRKGYGVLEKSQVLILFLIFLQTGTPETLERQGSGLIFNQRLGAYFYANQGVAEAFSACLLPCTRKGNGVLEKSQVLILFLIFLQRAPLKP